MSVTPRPRSPSNASFTTTVPTTSPGISPPPPAFARVCHRRGMSCSPRPPTPATGSAAAGYLTTPPPRPPCSSPAPWSGRCSSRDRPASARPSSRRRSPRAPARELIRLQCYEGLDESRALYEWNYKKQLLRIQAAPATPAWEQTHDDIFTEEFLLTRPLLGAIRREDPTVLLIDEIDKTDVEVEALLLEVLSDFQVTIPELGTVAATRRPFVVLTSNANRELSEALKRRCLYLYLDYPSQERERDILLERVPGLEPRARRAGRPHCGDAAGARAEEGAVDRRVDRLGAHPARARDRRPRRRRRRRDARRRAQARGRPWRARPRNWTWPPVRHDPPRPARRVRRRAARRGRAGLGRRGHRRGRRDRTRRPARPRADCARPTPRRWSSARRTRPAFDTLFDLYFPARPARTIRGAEP